MHLDFHNVEKIERTNIEELDKDDEDSDTHTTKIKVEEEDGTRHKITFFGEKENLKLLI